MKLHASIRIELRKMINGNNTKIGYIFCEKEYPNGCMSDEALVALQYMKIPCCKEEWDRGYAMGMTTIDLENKVANFAGGHSGDCCHTRHGSSLYESTDICNYPKIRKVYEDDKWSVRYELLPEYKDIRL